MSRARLEAMLALADTIDLAEGKTAYVKYNEVMRLLAEKYHYPIDRVVAVFAALSPSNDYMGNLKSTINVLKGLRSGKPIEEIIVTTYRHCLYRAIDYATGRIDFVSTVKGPKIRSFYFNLLDPSDHRYVTVDGHMIAAWRGQQLTMKEAIPKGIKEYRDVEHAVKAMAFNSYLLPNQIQATIWFTRKRLFRIKYNPQLNLFRPKDDAWGITGHD